MSTTEFLYVWFLGPVQFNSLNGPKVIIRAMHKPYEYSSFIKYKAEQDILRESTMAEF